MKFTADQIAKATGGRVLREAGEGPLWTDTRTLPAGAWFHVLSGARFDGHDFLGAAAERGALGAVVTREDVDFAGGLVLVPNAERALQDLGRAARDRLEGPVVGLTGSSGKTTTRALIALACSPLGAVHQTVGNLNNHLGVPLTLLAGDEQAAVSVVEMGTSGPGEIAVLADIGRPDVRLIVNVGPAHLEELGGLDGVAAEKGALFASARHGDVCCVNLDDARVAAMVLPGGVGRVTYGRHARADIRLVEARVIAERLSTVARYATPWGELETEIPAPGAHVAHNGAGALAVALALGVPLAEAADALRRYEPVGMRMRAERLPSGALALNDAYNANPDSMRASLGVLAALPGRRVAVLGDMLELGTGEASMHAELVGFADGLGLEQLVLVGPRMVAARGAATRTPCTASESVDGVGEALGREADGQTVLLFKGSRGARVERVLDAARTVGGEGT